LELILLKTAIPALLYEVVCDVLGGPGEFGETRVYAFVQHFDPLSEQASLF
jgi:hypothetical protein